MIAFLLQAVLISLSGVMAPGPLTATIVGRGARSPHAGALVALGHGVVEFPLMGLVLVGLGPWMDRPYVRPAVAAIGAAVLLWMGLGMLAASVRLPPGGPAPRDDASRSSLWSGVLLTGANPYFLVWWLSVGAALLLRATEFGRVGVGAFAVAHWLCDLGWFWFLSGAVFAGGRVFGRRFHQFILGACGLFLLAMAIDFLLDAYAATRG